MAWNADQYLKFAAPRLQPALDLLARVPEAFQPLRVVDLGCGTGSATQRIAARWPQAEVTGVDDSADTAGWAPAEGLDLIFSNAALHWLPDHATLFPALLQRLRPGGMLAVQMPRNFGAPSHQLIHDTVREGPWRDRLMPWVTPPPVAEPRWYIERLAPHVTAVDVWETEYQQLLTGTDPVKEYTKGTWLMRFLQALPPDEAVAFEADYATRVRAAYPPLADGRTLFPFRRLFILAVAR